MIVKSNIFFNIRSVIFRIAYQQSVTNRWGGRKTALSPTQYSVFDIQYSKKNSDQISSTFLVMLRSG